MIESDLAEFAIVLRKMARLFCRAMKAEEVEAYFDFLKDYSLFILSRATNKALEDRDPTDLYLKTVPLSALEIKQAADEILIEDAKASKMKVGCEKCNWTGWLIDVKPKQEIGQPRSQGIARRCECLLAAIRARSQEARK